jgi:hypothetical protein
LFFEMVKDIRFEIRIFGGKIHIKRLILREHF